MSAMAARILWALAGVGCAAVLAPLPGLHIYNVAALLLLLLESGRLTLASETTAFLFLGMVTGYAVLNTLASVFLSTPDETTLFLMLPGQRYLRRRRGYEAVVLSGVGSLAGLAALALLTPVAASWLPPIRTILQPHLPWLLWTVIAYMLLSEWPKGSGRAPAGWARWWDGWRSLLAGLATFLLSGLLGLILMTRPLTPVAVAYQNLMPAFIGLFAVPWILQNLRARVQLPDQHRCVSVDLSAAAWLHGGASGILGGLFAAFFPVVTGGIGSFLAGHATAQRDERAFLVSQGAAKVAYYVGGYLLFFVPGLHVTRGGMAWMLSTRYASITPARFYEAALAALLAGTVAFFLLLGWARVMARVVSRVPYPVVNGITLGVLVALVLGLIGPVGLAIMVVASAIGFIPVLWGSRRMNAMGILLLPIALDMAGVGDDVARWLGLI
jgi:putative membrane protein